MPTIGKKTSLKDTQAIGAVLLHQFARERFLQAGLGENLILEAENQEYLGDLTTGLFQVDDDDELSNDNDDRMSNQNISSSNLKPNMDFSSTSDSENHLSSTSYRSAANNSHDQNASMYHSMISNNNINSNVNNSATTSTKDNSSSPLDRIQSSSPAFASYGLELRRIAEEFERTRLRATVKQRAEKVKLSDITREGFVQLLEELFQEKITREKIVILFFFCTDVALRAAQLANELVVKLLGWSFSYIIDRVCQLIYKLGGWDQVLFHQLPSVLISVCAGLAIFSLIVYLRKSLKS